MHMIEGLNVSVTGEGTAVVLLHGFLESSTMWQPLVAVLSKKNKVICIDLPGFGKSPCVAKIHTMEFFAGRVKRVLDALNVQKILLIGHSMGGYVSLAFSELFPEKVNALVLLNSTPQADSPERKKQRNQAVILAQQNKERYVSLAINNLFTAKAKALFPEEIKQLKTQAKSIPLCGITAALLGMKQRKDRTQLLKNLSVPAFLLAGKDDPLIPYSVSKKIAEDARIKLFTLIGGHMAMIENKDEVVKFLHLIEYFGI